MLLIHESPTATRFFITRWLGCHQRQLGRTVVRSGRRSSIKALSYRRYRLRCASHNLGRRRVRRCYEDEAFYCACLTVDVDLVDVHMPLGVDFAREEPQIFSQQLTQQAYTVITRLPIGSG